MSDWHYSEEKRKREKRKKRERKDVRRGWDLASLSGRLYVLYPNPDHDEKVNNIFEQSFPQK